MRRLLTCLFFAATLSACEFTGAPPERIEISGVTAISDTDRLVIQERLDDSSWFAFLQAKPTFAVGGTRLTIRASTVPSDDDATRYLLSRQGRFRITSQGKRWVDEADVVDARVNLDAQGNTLLLLKFNDAGGRRLALLSAPISASESPGRDAG
jgi:hypothetical protein